MKHLKQAILALALVASPFQSSVYGCGDYDYDQPYYNIFDQLLLKERGLHPFLLTVYSGLYTTEEEIPDENLTAWISFLKQKNLLEGVSSEQFKTLLYDTPKNDLYRPTNKYVAMLGKSENGKAVLAYLQYAKEIEPYALLGAEDETSWTVKRVKSPSEANYTTLKNKGINLYKACKDKELKLRYGYQLVRLTHYMRTKNKEAITLFDLYVKPLQQEHYIYYAALEQVAGALYNIGDLPKANFFYTQVFDHSDSRKIAAYNSIRIQNKVNWNATLALCTSAQSQAALYAIRGYNTFSNEMEEAENIFKICPDSPYIRLLAIRYINKMEREVLSNYSVPEKHAYLQPSGEVMAEFAQTKGIIQKIIENPKAGDKDFWTVYLAHMSFLCREYKQAESLLSTLKTSDPTLLKQASRTRFCLYLTQLKSIGEQEKSKIAEYMAASDADVDFIKEVVGHLYKEQGDYGNAFLTHNPINLLQQNPDLNIINSLINKYEGQNSQSELISLYELKGTHFLRMGQFLEATKWYAKVPDTYFTIDSIYDKKKDAYLPPTPNQFNGYSGISPLLFSNGFKRLFNVPAASQLTDKLYQQYNYLNTYHTKATLAKALANLEEALNTPSEEGLRAAYLLANYYYNISPLGYYRNIPMYFDDNFNYYAYQNEAGNKVILPDFSKAYNYRKFEDESLVINYMSKALALFERVADNAQDRELSARAQFMASSCAINLYAPEWFLHSTAKKGKEYAEENAKVNIYYHKLATTFHDTAFYKEAVRECKYFEYYVKNEL